MIYYDLYLVSDYGTTRVTRKLVAHAKSVDYCTGYSDAYIRSDGQIFEIEECSNVETCILV